MCGRFVQKLSGEEIARLFAGDLLISGPGERYNVAPTQPVLVVVEHDRRVVTTHRWGLIPSWAKDPKIGARMINARAETLAEKSAFRTVFRHQRCLVPSDAFYEWQRHGTSKTPYAIVRRDGRPMAFAGLWSSWHKPDSDERILSCTIVTTKANELMAPLHDRMPAILPEDAWETWLDPAFQDIGPLQSLLRPYPSERLEAYPVSTRVNSVQNEGPELLARAE
ncbi:MAG TPA: SOS response-associated peptidase [Chloroflexota bacterium]|nr:SOS response-associated peptidase [Chloroflexota bacterium]